MYDIRILLQAILKKTLVILLEETFLPAPPHNSLILQTFSRQKQDCTLLKGNCSRKQALHYRGTEEKFFSEKRI
jgi:hypothetical protein